MTALDENPAPVSLWCPSIHPSAYLITCRRPVGHSGLHRSTNTPDWAEPSRVSPPTPSNEETPNAQR
jgi:hypothetical protein